MMKFYRVDIINSKQRGVAFSDHTQVFSEEARAKAYKAALLKAGHEECDVWLTTTP